ncbi:ribulose-phosphate 3-epimerase [Mechercharimyces sp. CAU 1602]|uniref:ribulose-phosphate 3-epimerase n=1 Tax=Mechercharimyces sp. CAU 1602 TaxID=2973933 RepID=UPI0021612BC4|nr:ribulose-phosphate 3-epimerase [Mechercharimyces sp. CAU 1602]MCS1351386.1 ribulose-phosphate 3-epimerase [Mechercharimyces sp. CAU 1602]
MVKLAPSILSADFACLKEEIADVERAGADWIHVDVMDGHFVPNLTLGPVIVEAIRPHTRLPLDVHLMMENPDALIPAFAKSGADYITVHQEACPHLARTLSLIKEHGVRAGVVLNPATPAMVLEPIIQELDLILLMTVNPGFGGQAFLPSVLPKIKQVRQMCIQQGHPDILIQVDGGISPITAADVVLNGADVLVAGSAIFAQEDRAAAMKAIRDAVGTLA